MIKTIRVNKKLYVDEKFFEFLNTYNNRICSLILGIDTIDSLNYISIHDNEMVSFLPASKYKLLEDNVVPYSSGIGRMNMKVGRIISKLFTQEVFSQFTIDMSDIEDFVNLYKSHFDESKIELRIVEGEEIKKWYYEKNYLMPDGNCFGSLWKSCMRYEKKLNFLNLYTLNPQFKMLVMIQKNESGSDSLRARALLVDAETADNSYLPKGTPVKTMDRIYSVYDSDIQVFKKWAKENGYITKFEQNNKSKPFFVVDDETKFLNLVIKPDNFHLEYYPYLDTFSYFNWETGEFFNNSNFYHDYTLIQTDGSLGRELVLNDDGDDVAW